MLGGVLVFIFDPVETMLFILVAYLSIVSIQLEKYRPPLSGMALVYKEPACSTVQMLAFSKLSFSNANASLQQCRCWPLAMHI